MTDEPTDDRKPLVRHVLIPMEAGGSLIEIAEAEVEVDEDDRLILTPRTDVIWRQQ